MKNSVGESDIVMQVAEIRRDAAKAQGLDATLIREQPPAEKNNVVTQDDDGMRIVSSAPEFERRMKSNEGKHDEVVLKITAYTDRKDSRLERHLSAMEAQLRELQEACSFAEAAKTKFQDAEMTLSSSLDSMGLRLTQDAGRVSTTEAQRGEFLEECCSANDTKVSEELAHAIIKSIRRSFSSASSCGGGGDDPNQKSISMPLAMNIVQTEKIHEVPLIGAATRDTGLVKRWFNDRSFGFITPKDGGQDVYVHWKHLLGTKVLKQGDTVPYET